MSTRKKIVGWEREGRKRNNVRKNEKTADTILPRIFLYRVEKMANDCDIEGEEKLTIRGRRLASIRKVALLFQKTAM